MKIKSPARNGPIRGEERKLGWRSLFGSVLLLFASRGANYPATLGLRLWSPRHPRVSPRYIGAQRPGVRRPPFGRSVGAATRIRTGYLKAIPRPPCPVFWLPPCSGLLEVLRAPPPYRACFSAVFSPCAPHELWLRSRYMVGMLLLKKRGVGCRMPLALKF